MFELAVCFIVYYSLGFLEFSISSINIVTGLFAFIIYNTSNSIGGHCVSLHKMGACTSSKNN